MSMVSLLPKLQSSVYNTDKTKTRKSVVRGKDSEPASGAHEQTNRQTDPQTHSEQRGAVQNSTRHGQYAGAAKMLTRLLIIYTDELPPNNFTGRDAIFWDRLGVYFVLKLVDICCSAPFPFFFHGRSEQYWRRDPVTSMSYDYVVF